MCREVKLNFSFVAKNDLYFFTEMFLAISYVKGKCDSLTGSHLIRSLSTKITPIRA